MGAPPACTDANTVTANIVALDEPLLYNRMGAGQPGGMIFALQSEVVPSGFPGAKPPQSYKEMPTPDQLKPGQVMLRPGKRPRPLVLRVNQGECLRIEFTNLLSAPQPSRPLPPQFNPAGGPNCFSGGGCGAPPQKSCPSAQSFTDGGTVPACGTMPGTLSGGVTQLNGINAGVTVLGLEPTPVSGEDALLCQYSPLGQQPPKGATAVPMLCNASLVGTNPSSLLPPASPQRRGNGRYYNVAYTYYAAKEGTFLLYSSGQTWTGYTQATQLSVGLFGAVNVEPSNSETYRSQLTGEEFGQASQLQQPGGKPFVQVDYDATYAKDYQRPDKTWVAAGTPVLKMVHNRQIIATDLNAVVTGPKHGPLVPAPGKPADFCTNSTRWNPSYPSPCEPYREFTTIYHEDFNAVQAFASITPPAQLLTDGADKFAINYGIGGISAEILANRLPVKQKDGSTRIGTGPGADCTECKFEEFFLSSWANGDPAMLVDRPTNMANPSTPATKALYADDPSNVHHSYLGDHVRFRVLHAGQIHHIHHLHAHQWLFSQEDPDSAYLDSQAIGPGSAYTQDITYGGSGNRNRTPGDSIFHCHFYPHFAAGMWSLWRVHDVFELGTRLNPDGTVTAGSRALPDGEITAGTPIPAVTPLPLRAEAPLPAPVCVQNGQISTQCANPVPAATDNPGFPLFIPGVAGHRPPHPPIDFAMLDGKEMNGGLPRHVVETSPKNHATMPEGGYTDRDFGKEIEALVARQLPEKGTDIERKAIEFSRRGTHPSFTPDGKAGPFLTNGLGPQPGAPIANPCGKDWGWTGRTLTYKAAAIQTDAVLTKKGWHYPQQRMLSLWDDVKEYFYNRKPPEPLFIRANSGDCVEYWHTNLVPNVFDLDDFEVRTPTDILGQHIHLVKFDVLASDGAANGWNYEDGTFSPDEVRERINAINKVGGLLPFDGKGNPKILTPVAPPEKIFGKAPPGQNWLGAQTTIQRWLADPVKNDKGQDRTLRTVFTHDHFGPSTHQQVGLYAGLLVEPANSSWLDPVTGLPLGTRKSDGGPTSFQANIVPLKGASFEPYREFAMMFQDDQFAYQSTSVKKPDPKLGWADPTNALNANNYIANTVAELPSPNLVTNGTVGVSSINYRAEPLPFRVNNAPGQPCAAGADPKATDGSHVFRSIARCDPALNVQPSTYRPLSPGIEGTDPYTPLLRAYQGDKVQMRLLVGAHLSVHTFSINGVNWLFEPSSPDSGYRGTQVMGLSEHYELEFKLPKGSSKVADYLYKADNAEPFLSTGLWGLMRGYGELQKDGSKLTLQPLPGNANPGTMPVQQAICPPGAPLKQFKVVASTSQQLLANRPGLNKAQLVFSPRGPHHGCDTKTSLCRADGKTSCTTDAACPDTKSPQIVQNAMMYVRWDDLDDKTHTTLKDDKPIEPLVLRANAGDCVQVTLTNQVQGGTGMIGQQFNYWQALSQFGPGDPVLVQLQGNTAPAGTYLPNMTLSGEVGLHPQLVAYDISSGDGINVGKNPVQTVTTQGGSGAASQTYTWYMGRIENGKPQPVEFGAVNLIPADPLGQPALALTGALIVEPQGATVIEDQNSRTSATVTKDGKSFREFVVIAQESLIYNSPLSSTADPASAPDFGLGARPTGQALNYGTTPFSARYSSSLSQVPDISCVLSNRLLDKGYSPGVSTGDPSTPVFTASAKSEVRVRLLHALMAGPSVTTLANHAWQFEPYTNGSTTLGFNPESHWTGSQMGYSAANHYDAIIPSAGGAFGVPGDYVFENFNMGFTKSGSWGLFRVGQGSDTVALTNVVQNTSGVLVQGVNGVQTQGANVGKFSPTVTLFATANCSGIPLAQATVGPDGGWSASLKQLPPMLCARSGGGSTNLWAFNVPGACGQPQPAGAPAPMKVARPASRLQEKLQQQLEDAFDRKSGRAPDRKD